MPQDILLDPVTLDLQFANGDLVIGDSSQQQEALLLLSVKGDAKDFPDRGVGLINFINADDTGGMISETRAQLVKDGATVKSVKYENGQLEIDAKYP